MAELKTKPSDKSVEEFLNSIDDPIKRKDSFTLLEIFKDIMKLEPKLWGDAIVGFGDYSYKSDSGRTGDWFVAGFSPRKQALSLYLMCGFERFSELMDKLGKHKSGKGCLYIKRLDEVNVNILKEIIQKCIKDFKEFGFKTN